MAGRELSGYGAALPDLFVGRPWVTVPGRFARLIDGERVSELIEACGGLQIQMGAEAHDRAVAAISHMPLVGLAALVEAVAGGPGAPERADWAATGDPCRDRLGRHDPPGPWRAGHGRRHRRDERGRHRSPADATCGRQSTSGWRNWSVKGGPDAEALRARFTSARDRLEKRGPHEGRGMSAGSAGRRPSWSTRCGATCSSADARLARRPGPRHGRRSWPDSIAASSSPPGRRGRHDRSSRSFRISSCATRTGSSS